MTRILANQRWRCDYCGAVTLQPALLNAPSPFNADDILAACPNCKQCDVGFTLLCDEPGCNRDGGGCGWPTGDDADAWGGYRNTCYQHSDYDQMHRNLIPQDAP
jgi:hypothetical protein